MASPFDLFRKNQKVLMALLVGFAMFAFIAADSIDATTFPIFLGAMFGALGLWLLSGKGGTEGWMIAAVGGVIGAVVGVYGPGLLGGNTVVQTAEGDLSRQDVERLLQRQDQANQFLGFAHMAVRDKLPEAEQAQLRQPPYFGFGDTSTVESRTQAAVTNFLFQKEADDLGITISDEAVTRFLNDVFDGKLTRADLQRVAGEMRIGTGELVDVLREQIRARQASLLLAPRSGPTPEELWAEYKKLETTAEVTAVAVPADAFVSQVADPSPSDVAAYFDRYKSVPAPAPRAPGLLVPRQFQVAYLEIGLDEMKKSVTPPTDEEVRAFYEANRSRFEFDQRPPGGSAIGNPAGGTPPGDAPPVEAPRPAAAADAATDEADATPEAEEAAAPEASEATPPQEPAEAPAAPPQEPTEGPAGEESSAVGRDGFEFVAFQAEEPAEAAAEPPAGDAAQPAAAEQPPAFPPAPEERKAAGPTPETLKAIREDLLNQRARDEADRRLVAAREYLDRVIAEVFDPVLPPDDPEDAEGRKKYETERRAAVETVRKRLEEYAGKNGLKYRATPLLSAPELYDSEDYSIGKAVLWEANRPFLPRDATSVAAALQQSAPEQPLSTIAAQSPIDESRFVAIKVADAEPHVPTLEEEGIKQRVVDVWKLEQAQELAKKRAEELAKADDGKKDLAEAVKGQTVTGKSGGQELTSRQVGPFTWLQRTTVPGAMFNMPDIVPTTLGELPGAGERFMQAVFGDLRVGETAVVPSEDGSAYYVVEVDSRSNETDLAKLREGFMNEEFFFFLSPYRMRMAEEARENQMEWLRTFRAKHGVVDPAAEPVPAA